MRSRQAFIPLIACISFFLRILYHLENQWVELITSDHQSVLPSPNPFWSKRQREYEELRRGPVPSKWEWQDRLQRETSISSEWLAYFHQIMDIPMVGSFVDVRGSDCLPWIPVFLEARMPLMLYWGTLKDWSVPDVLNGGIIPIPAGIVISTLASEQTPYVPPSKYIEENVHQVGVSESRRRLRLPRLDGGSLPRPNEDLLTFIERREAHRLKAIASESSLARQSRLQREENARKDRPPGKKGARVYYWDLVEGIRVRTAVGRSNYEDIWERYGSRQRRYDSVADEWEVCTDLDPDDVPDYHDLDFEDDDDDYFISVQAHMNEQTGHHMGVVSSEAYLTRLHSSKDDSSVASIEFPDSIEDVARHRLGFLSQRVPDNRNIVLKSQAWKNVLGLLGSGRHPPNPEPDDYVKLQLSTFTAGLLNAVDLRHAPQAYDLAVKDSTLRPVITFEIDVLSSHNGQFFLIQAKDASDSDPFLIALRSAATVMEISRRKWGPGTEDIIKQLINQGMSFNTLMPSYPPRHHRSIPCRRPAMLGFRPVGFVPTLQDYRSYEAARNDFLRSARGRAALLAGGIIARLARGVVNENDIYDGPTEHALQKGERALCVLEEGASRAFWDDQLTLEEMDLICGSYEVATGFISKDGIQQTAIRSWWPRSGAWKSCGLNCGFWSEDAEDWFLTRLHKILHMDVLSVMTGQEWRAKLKFRKAHSLSNKNDCLSKEYLKTQYHLPI
ncbi:hypothetical protein C8J55DRAFT_492089 [Lentinula edodes]|uniref:Uncharacterized protein n=1 Tax=Lentinula lateritia TaxID=40482 RepID=A0A9W9DGF7_9AGAR|nr:hypothetical protein C8J55DRAFT_492089 [Lentinula edodes]